MAYNPQNPNGQATSADSTPVVLASDQNNSLETGGNLEQMATLLGTLPTSAAISTLQITINEMLDNMPSALNVATLQTSLNTLNTNVGTSGTSLQSTLSTMPTAAQMSTFQSSLNELNTNIGTSGTSLQASLLASPTTLAAPASARTIGTKAVSSDPANTTSGYATIPIADLSGKLITMPYAINQNFISGVASATDTTSTQVIASAASGIKIYITGVVIVNTGVTTAAVNIQNGNGGTTLLTGIAPAGNGQTINLPVPIPTSAATGVYFAAGSSSSTVYVTVTGYTGA
jgi:hypothetical protein